MTNNFFISLSPFLQYLFPVHHAYVLYMTRMYRMNISNSYCHTITRILLFHNF